MIDPELQEAYNKCAMKTFEEIEKRERANCQCAFCKKQREAHNDLA